MRAKLVELIAEEIARKTLKSLENGIFASADNHAKLTPVDTCRILSEIKTETEEELLIRNFILGRCLSAESKAPSSAYAIIKCMTNIANSNNFFQKRTNFTTAKSILNFLAGDGLISGAIISANKMSGVSGKIIIEVQEGNEGIFVYKRAGLRIAGKASRNDSREFIAKKIILYDGHLESISEMHSLLFESEKDGIFCVVVCRSCTDSAMSDLERMHKNFTIFCPYAIENFEKLKNTWISSNKFFVSLDLGTTFLSRLENFPIIEVKIDNDAIELFDSSLSDIAVVILLKAKEDMLGILEDRMSACLAIFRMTLKSGVSYTKTSNSDFFGDEQCMPYYAHFFGYKVALSIMQELTDLGCIVMQKEDLQKSRKSVSCILEIEK